MSLETAAAQKAVRQSIQTEKNAMDFYRYGANLMKDEQARRVFDVLAQEERSHAASFYMIYTGSDIPSLEAFLDAPPEHESEWIAALKKQIDGDFNEKKALELAMQKELNLEEALLKQALEVKEPTIKSVYEMNARETHNHYLLIEAEYSRLMGMVDDSEMDTFVRE